MKFSQIKEFIVERANFAVPVIIIGGLAITLVTVLLLTSVFWIPLAIMFLPVFLTLYGLIKYTPLGKPVNWVITKIYDWIFYESNLPRKFFWELIYNCMGYLYPIGKWKTMNYGYALLNDNGHTINLDNADEDERFSLQLYHHVVSGMGKIQNLQDKVVLEVGSGRGGGLNYIRTYLKAKKCYGVDVSISQIEFCRNIYKDTKELYYYQGNAENFSNLLALQNEQIDIIINVESSHCYGNFSQFMAEVEKVLRPGGYFIITDFRSNQAIPEWRRQLEAGTLKIIYEEDITINVLHSLKLDESRRMALINETVNTLLRSFFAKFSGLTNSRIYKEFKEQKTLYMCYLLQKQ